MSLRFSYIICIALLLSLAACGGGGAKRERTSTSGEAGGPIYKVGNPYQIKGETYTPHEDYSYDETGIASWYGADFHGGKTANGEIFNKDELTAAHKTLPLPTLARVTNLDNGKSIVVRINDRGPFSGARLIDMSQRAAQLLGFEQQGTAKVRVQVLADESKAIADAMRHYGAPTTTSLASAEAPAPAAAPLGSIQTASLEPVETQTLAPITTTPAVHQQLLQTQPVAQVLQLPVTGARQIYVQAGAFTVLDNATRLQHSLSKFGNVVISDLQINGKLFHRVRVGPIKDVASADNVLAQVRGAGNAGARTIVD